MTLQKRRRGVDGTESHLRGIERRPLRINNATLRRQLEFLDGPLRRDDQPHPAVRDLRAVARGHVAVFRIEKRTELREIFRRRILAHAVVQGVKRPFLVVERNDFVGEITRLLGGQHALVTACRVDVHLRPINAESKGQVLGGLSHEQTDDRIGQSLHQADHRRQESGLEAREQRRTTAERLRGVPTRQPQHHRVGEQKRRARQRINAAGQHEIGTSGANIVDRRIERLHTRRAIAHHGPAGDFVPAAHP